MSKSFLIKHEDIAGVGYYFLEKNQEEQYLESINSELAVRVDTEIRKRLSISRQMELSNLSTEEIFDRVKNRMPDIDHVIEKIRSTLLNEIREKRRDILIKE